MHSGSEKRLPPKIRKRLSSAVFETAGNKKIVLNLCINYGGRQEIVEGVNNWLSSRKEGEKFTAKKMEKYLYTAGLPEVDLIIRTSGEYRISNFLLWQLPMQSWPLWTFSGLILNLKISIKQYMIINKGKGDSAIYERSSEGNTDPDCQRCCGFACLFFRNNN
jgi:hypothetical protein